MRSRGSFAVALVGILAGGTVVPAHGAGFGIFEQGTKAMGMAGAFTAQADDPSAMFHNVAGLAFQRERDLMAGTTFITQTKADFQGAAPFPGPGETAEQEDAIFFPTHIYYVHPLRDRLSLGIAFNTPFGLATEWDPEGFSGRFISHRAELQSFDLVPSAGWRVSESFGVGLGIVARSSFVELEQRAGLINPFTFTVVDVANVELESDLETDIGFTLGVLHDVNEVLSWGFSYRSKIETEYGGDARFRQISTGIPALDAAVAQSLPFGRDVGVETAIEFPDMASVGVALSITPELVVEADANWTGWSSFDTLVIDFDDAVDPSGELDVVRSERWDDAYNFRLGVQWSRGTTQWRAGYVFDETPQPTKAASPLLPDADRNGFTAGIGWRGDRFYGDLALMYLIFDETEVGFDPNDDDLGSIDGFYGTYDITAWLLGITVGWK